MMRLTFRASATALVLAGACTLSSCNPSANSAVPATPGPSTAATAQAAAPKPSGPAKSWNVIMISMNNMGAEYMGMYGYRRPTTPKLQALSSQGMVFESAFAPNSWTLPGATSLMTSVQPYTHGVQDRLETNMLNPGWPTLAELFKNRGYATAAFTGSLDYRPTFGHLRGITDSSFNLDFTRFSTSLKQAERWLSYNKEKPFFLVLQGYDCHPPFQPPKPFKGSYSGGHRNVHVSTKYALRGYKSGDKYIASYIWQSSDPKKRRLMEIAYPPKSARRNIELTQEDITYLADLYDECVMSVDAQVAEFIEHLDKKTRENTLILVFSEHGEMFAKHGRFGRAGTVRGTLFDDVVHVPLMIFSPDGKTGHFKGLVQLIDIAPTILDMMGIEIPTTFQGKSLTPLLAGKDEVNDYVFGGSQYNVSVKGQAHPFFKEASVCEFIRNHKWKLIHEIVFSANDPAGPASKDAKESWELYDLKSDPAENKNLVDSYKAVAEELKKRLAEWSQSTRAAMGERAPTTVGFPPDFEERARTHGYW